MAEKISLEQGAGGELMDNLIKEKILKHFSNNSKKTEVTLSMLDDAAVVDDIVFRGSIYMSIEKESTF